MPNFSKKYTDVNDRQAVDALFSDLEAIAKHYGMPYVQSRIDDICHRMTDASNSTMSPPTSRDIMLVSRAQEIMLKNILAPLSTQQIAAECGVSATKVKRAFREVEGMPAQEWFRTYRMNLSKELLARTDLPISQIAASVGYSNASKFSRAFKGQTGMNPREWRNGSR